MSFLKRGEKGRGSSMKLDLGAAAGQFPPDLFDSQSPPPAKTETPLSPTNVVYKDIFDSQSISSDMNTFDHAQNQSEIKPQFSFQFNENDQSDNHNYLRQPSQTIKRLSTTSPLGESFYSPRLSVVSVQQSNATAGESLSNSSTELKDDYKGFHANHKGKGLANVPPLREPIKPRFKKKSGSLLGKLIYSSRRESEIVQPTPETILTKMDDQQQTPHFNSIRSSSLGNVLPIAPHKPGVSSVPSNFKTSRRSTSSSGSSVSSHKHKFRIPSMTSLDPYHAFAPAARQESAVSSSKSIPEIVEPSSGGSSASASRLGSTTFDLDLNDLQGIIKPKDELNIPLYANSPRQLVVDSNFLQNFNHNNNTNNNQNTNSFQNNNQNNRQYEEFGNEDSNIKKSFSSVNMFDQTKASWKAPDSWDVNIEAKSSNGTPSSESDGKKEDDDDDDDEEMTDDEDDCSSRSTVDNENSTHKRSHHHHHHHHHKDEKHHNRSHIASPGLEEISQKLMLPVLYGSRHSFHVVPPSSSTNPKGPNHIVRIFKQDNTFTTILCPLETTTAELLTIVQRKFFLENIANYQISVYIGNCVKVLESFEQPLKIQMGLLNLSGYLEKDNLSKIGREDLSYVCKFVLEDIYLRNLTHEEEVMLSKDYVDVNISGLNLKNIPIIFHQHTYEIEKLNVGDNPSIYIPLDFIQSCNNLTSIIFSRNGASKFPMNFLEAKKLTHLDLQKNFLDEISSKFGTHLKNLTHLRLNSNQLSTLPKSFGKLQNLISLNLSSNYFNNYPESISDLVNLIDLDLSYNDLSVLPESISRLQKLAKLNLCTNKLEKSLPEYFTKLQSLKRLDIRYNKISNIDVLGSLPLLEVAYASKNNISAFSDRMENLRLLHFDRNPITDLQFENLLPILTVLDLSKAKITSVPSDFISRIPNIEKLVLDKNHLVSLPDEIGNLTKLASLSLYGNYVQFIPDTIGKLSSLQYLDLHLNNLQTLPDSIWNLKSLITLNVSSNILSNFPKPPISIVKRISLSVNFKNLIAEATGGVVAESRRGSTTSTATTSTATTPSESSSTDYDTVGGANNKISNSLVDSLASLILADNRLNDECFESISFLIELKSLNLSYNFLVEIPEGACRRMVKLSELYLSGNELTSLPVDDLEILKALKLLFINNNKFVTLPGELSKLTNLQTLDVGSNQLKYNISNWPYDWNWHWNKALKYLNFSGNKRFEIKQSHVKNPETGEDFDSLLVLKNLKVLGLIDVTLTTTSVPDQNSEMRIRTTASELDNVGYGVSDAMGARDNISSRDIFIQKFRGIEGEVLLCSMDGKLGKGTYGHRVSAATKAIFVPNFTEELNKLVEGETIYDALRRAFLSLNKEINGHFSSLKNEVSNSGSSGTHSNTHTGIRRAETIAALDLANDGSSGCSLTVVYIKDKKVYTANTGDVEALLCRNNGNHVLLTKKHDPTIRNEFERIRASGGYVTGDGNLDGDLPISRGVGFFNYLPHTHSGPDISEYDITSTTIGGSGGVNDVIIIGTKVLWDYITYELAVDIVRQEKDDPMRAAQKLRDYAIGYGATDKISVNVLTLGEHQRSPQGNYNNLSLKYSSSNPLIKDAVDLFNNNKKRRDRNPLAGAGDSVLRRLDDEIDPPIGELALVFTDIKNSTLLWDSFPVAMRSAIKIHNAIMRRQLRIVGGYEVKTEGDAFMVSFPSPSSALLWCYNVQQQLIIADWPSEILETDSCCEIVNPENNIVFRGLSVRMGIHWGSPVYELDVVTRRMDYFGPMVNRTSRINAVADGGQIAVSSDFLDEIESLNKTHRDIASKKVTLQDAYLGNVRVGEIIERELSQLDELQSVYFEIGERKLKGLEAPEFITLAYPSHLKFRYDIFNARIEAEEVSDLNGGEIAPRIIASIPTDSIYGLRLISLRLENVCIFLSEGSQPHNTFSKTSSDKISEQISFKENDTIAMLSHIVSRIENNVALFQLRQLRNIKNGGNGDIMQETDTPFNIWDLISELSEALEKLKV